MFVDVIGGLHIVDVNRERLRPTFIGCLADDAYTHDAKYVVYCALTDDIRSVSMR